MEPLAAALGSYAERLIASYHCHAFLA